MAIEKLNISGWDAGWPGGFVSNVDEPVASADGSTVSTTIENDVVIFDLTDVVDIGVLDTVTAVAITIRGKVATGISDARYRVELLIGGVSQGADLFVSDLSTVLSNQTYAAAGWDSAWTIAQLNGAQVKVTAQKDQASAETWYIDCIDVDVTYTAVDPVTRDPGEATLALTGKQPDADLSSEFPLEEPPAGSVALTGKAPGFGPGITIDTGTLAAAGKTSYINSLQERLNPNAWNGTAVGWTGFVSNIDEPVANADGSTVGTTDTNPVTIDFSNVPTGNIVDLSTVLSITGTIRCAGMDASPEPTFETATVTLLIDGVSRGSVVIFPNLNSFSNIPLANTSWNQDWTVAQLNSLQLKITPSVLGGSASFLIDCIDIVVEHVPQSPFVLPIPAGDLSLTGKAPTKTVNFLEAPAVGATTLAGKVPDFFRFNTERVPYVQARLNAKTPTVLANVLRTPARYAAALAGKTPLRIGKQSITPAVGGLTFAAKTPVRAQTQDYVISPTRVRLTTQLQNVLPQYSAGTNTYIDPGRLRVYIDTYVIAGASLSDNPQLVPPKLTADLTGQAPLLSYGALPAAYTMTLNGKAVPYTVGGRPAPAEATLSLAGQAPRVDGTAGYLTLTGYAPALSNERTPAAAALALASEEPLLVYNGAKLPLRGVLQLSGYAPTLRVSTLLTPGLPGLINLTVDYDIEFIGTPFDEQQY